MSSTTAPRHRALRGMEANDLVTGEAVLLDIPAAALPQRMASALIDLVVAWGGLILSLFAVATIAGGLSEALLATLVLLVSLTWLLVLPVTLETLTRGRTLGKLAMHLRTVREDGGPIVFRHALVRGLIGFIEVYLLSGVPALLTAMSTDRSRRLGDLAAGTYVVREATHLRPGPAPYMPPALIPWAQSADIAPLPDGVALAVRQLLGRADQLSPQARATVGQQLLGQVLPLVSPQPPRGASAEAVLAAVLGERRRRDELRLGEEQRLRQRVVPADDGF